MGSTSFGQSISAAEELGIDANAGLQMPHLASGNGTQIVVPVQLTNTDDEIFAADLTITYDPTILQIVSVEKGDLASGLTMFANTSTPGEIRVSMAATVPVTTGGEFLLLTFNVVGTLGQSTALTFTRADLEPDLGETPIVVDITPGSFTVGAVPHTGAGTISLQGVISTSTFAAIGVTVTLAPDIGGTSTVVIVSADGSFSVDVEVGSYTITAYAPGFLTAERPNLVVIGSGVVLPSVELRGGDANEDGVVSIRDISIIAVSFGATPETRVDGSGRIVDINGDGVVDIMDISNAASNFGAVEPTSW
jgi:hypothetical protein